MDSLHCTMALDPPQFGPGVLGECWKEKVFAQVIICIPTDYSNEGSIRRNREITPTRLGQAPRACQAHI